MAQDRLRGRKILVLIGFTGSSLYDRLYGKHPFAVQSREEKQRMRNKKDQKEKATKGTRIAAYIRVSTDEQAESGLGLASQRARCKAMAEAKGWNEPTFYEDAGYSGTKTIEQRPGLQALMNDVRGGKVEVIIVLSLDRLARVVRITLDIAEELRQHCVDLVSCKESIDTSTPHGNFFFVVTAAFAQLERDLISQRTVDALAERVKRDGIMGGKLPYGYKRVFEIHNDKRVCVDIEIDSEEAQFVRKIFAMNRRGISLRKIGEAIGKRHTSIVEILKNKEVYKGGKRGESDFYWPAIL